MKHITTNFLIILLLGCSARPQHPPVSEPKFAKALKIIFKGIDELAKQIRKNIKEIENAKTIIEQDKLIDIKDEVKKIVDVDADSSRVTELIELEEQITNDLFKTIAHAERLDELTSESEHIETIMKLTGDIESFKKIENNEMNSILEGLSVTNDIIVSINNKAGKAVDDLASTETITVPQASLVTDIVSVLTKHRKPLQIQRYRCEIC